MDALRQLFSDSVLTKLMSVVGQRDASYYGRNGQHIFRRAAILGIKPPEAEWQRAYREAWMHYLEAAQVAGMLDDRELVTNLIGTNDDGFRGAMAECLCAWVFSKLLSFSVHPKPVVRDSGGPDFLLRADGSIYVETKAPFTPLRTNAWSGDDTNAILKSITSARRQFVPNEKNILAIAPVFRTPVWSERDQLTKAVLGEEVYELSWSLDDSRAYPTKPVAKFLINGKLSKPRAHGRRDLTRLSAVLVIEEVLERTASNLRLNPRILVFHNPFAANPIDPTTFAGLVQCIPDRERQIMLWNDAPAT